MNNFTPEILINSTLVQDASSQVHYEFVLNQDLNVVECVKIASIAQGVVLPIHDPLTSLNELLFQFNHVRINPRMDNTHIIQALTQRLSAIGVNVSGQEQVNASAVSFKSIGEISDNVRFYIKPDAEIVFLSTAQPVRLVSRN